MIVPLMLVLIAGPSVGPEQRYSCLPPDVKVTDVVSAERSGGDHPRLVIVTVRQRLGQLHARCAGERLVDGQGKAIRFYRLHCFGAPTGYAQETMRRERAELADLRKRYTIVAMTCSPTGEPTP